MDERQLEQRESAAQTHFPLPAIVQLHTRHFGVTQAEAGVFAESAGVCFARHHVCPTIVSLLDTPTTYLVSWPLPDDRTLAAYANVDDATRDGAYGVSLAVVEHRLELVALARAETRTGADFYVGPSGMALVDLEDVARLEVSGTDHGDEAEVRRRLKKKVDQVGASGVNGPALACVVGFKAAAVAVQQLLWIQRASNAKPPAQSVG